jgi:aminoglycoside phosphotransferase (APT) family kinase protein
MAGNVWDAEHALDAAGARALLAAQHPALELSSVEEIAYGFDNTVFLVDGTWAVRFPRRQMGADLFAKELRLLPALAPLLPVAVPVPELVGEPGDGFPWPWWGARLLPGTEVADARLPEHGRAALGAGVGAFLAALHRPEIARRLGPGLPVDPMRRATPSTRGPVGRASLDRLAAGGHWTSGSRLDRAYDDLVARGSGLEPPVGELVLVHGDFHLRHVLVGDDGAPTGVIDWGDACLADPALDLSFGYAALSGADREVFLSAYGDRPDPERELRARVLAAALCAVLAEYATTEDRPALLTESLAGIARALS